MWLFLPFGFFSAVFVSTPKGDSEKIGGIFPEGAIMVRARSRKHLEVLIDKTGDRVPIVEQYGSDYAFRIFLTRQRWTEIVARFAMGIDYSNFKNRAHHEGDKDYCDALHRIWSTMYGLQKSPHTSEVIDEPQESLGDAWADYERRNQKNRRFDWE